MNAWLELCGWLHRRNGGAGNGSTQHRLSLLELDGDASRTSNPVTVTMDGDKSVTANFSAAGMVLGAPSGTVTSWDGSFHWTGLANATWYLLEVFRSDDTQMLYQWYTAEQVGCASGTDCAVTPAGLNLANGDYKWHLLDYGEYGYGSFTPFKTFTLNAACYQLTTVVNPTGSGVINAPAQNCAGGYQPGRWCN